MNIGQCNTYLNFQNILCFKTTTMSKLTFFLNMFKIHVISLTVPFVTSDISTAANFARHHGCVLLPLHG